LGTLHLLDSTETYDITLSTPQFSYVSEIHMPICVSKAADGTYKFFDPPDGSVVPVYGTFDYRLCIIDNWILSAEQKATFNEFVRNVAKGRAETFTMRLGDSSQTGFYPFGPDYADAGDYTVRLLTQEQTGALIRPYGHFKDKIALIMVTASETLPVLSGGSQGSLQIGSVTGLMMPQDGFQPKAFYNVKNDYTASGVPYSMDSALSSDSWETQFDQYCNSQKAYDLVTQLVTTSRTADISIVAPAGYYVYGYDQASSGTYTSKFLGSSIEDKEIVVRIEHYGVDQWKIPLSFWMKAKA
jgi:hypothetical protein